ncbi:beta-glucuronosyltransferase GlcAT14A [Telopea speciosissima]|uniref:beta-glucuronosyltransferase GlcAT14A n=1 Tax=Telopea speciosissima TaxID=54955 RepID=UPI001CC5E77D|nr:beta-glucuronosyltransferase GlcAT14A [Telopea speciosissima]
MLHTPLPTSLQATATTSKEKKKLYSLLVTSIVFLIFIFFVSSSSSGSSSSSSLHYHKKHRLILGVRNQADPNSVSPSLPSIAYFITGCDGDSNRLLRLLFSLYHPNNQYLLHLDLTASQSQRDQLALTIQSIPVFRDFQNVNVIGKADFAYLQGSSAIASTLHGASILLRLSMHWDWFINLSAADYPLVTQDDLLHILSFLPKDLNFVNHTNYIGWRESFRMKPIIVDPGLYISEKSYVFYATQKRELPNAYRLFTGLSSAVLSRKFVEFCVFGSDNLPRILLMYFSNMPSSQTNYFQTALCNSREFNKTVVNHNLQYLSWDDPPKQKPRTLGSSDFDDMIKSGAAFGTPFPLDDPVLDRIDKEVLNRGTGRIVPGGWCLGEADDDPCSVWGDGNALWPGKGSRRLEKRLVELLSKEVFHSHQCIIE